MRRGASQPAGVLSAFARSATATASSADSGLELLEAIERKTAIGIATYRRWGRDERRRGWAELWDRDEDRYLAARLEWFATHRAEVSGWLD